MTNAQEYFVVKNWKNFQQYKDRDPNWIKLHMRLLDDYEFCQMPEADQIHLVKIWLLFAKENPPSSTTLKPLPVDVKFISGKVAAKRAVRLDRLLQTTFLELHTVKDSERTDSILNRTPYNEYKPETYKPYKKEGEGEEESKPTPPPPEFLKILKTCQGIRRVTRGVPNPFDDPRDGAIVQEFLDAGYKAKQIQIAFFIFCAWDNDSYLKTKPRTFPLFKSQLENYMETVQKTIKGTRWPAGHFDFKKEAAMST